MRMPESLMATLDKGTGETIIGLDPMPDDTGAVPTRDMGGCDRKGNFYPPCIPSNLCPVCRLRLDMNGGTDALIQAAILRLEGVQLPLEIPKDLPSVETLEKGMHNIEDIKEPFWPKDNDRSKGHRFGDDILESGYKTMPAMAKLLDQANAVTGDAPFLDEECGPVAPNSPLWDARLAAGRDPMTGQAPRKMIVPGSVTVAKVDYDSGSIELECRGAGAALSTEDVPPQEGNIVPYYTEIPARAATCMVVVDNTTGFEISRDYEAMVRHSLGILSKAPSRDQIESLGGKGSDLKREKLDGIQARDRANKIKDTAEDERGQLAAENECLAKRVNEEKSRATGNWWFGFAATCAAAGMVIVLVISLT